MHRYERQTRLQEERRAREEAERIARAHFWELEGYQDPAVGTKRDT